MVKPGHTLSKIFFVLAALLILGGCVHMQKYPGMTVSGRAVILPGQQYTDLLLPVPTCTLPEEFLVQGVHAGPELVIGNTQASVARLPLWGISVPVYQREHNGSRLVALTAVAKGPEALSAEIPAGQYMLGPRVSALAIRISILGGTVAKDRFEFNVHVTGTCGLGYVAP
jgi:hypothetical protein